MVTTLSGSTRIGTVFHSEAVARSNAGPHQVVLRFWGWSQESRWDEPGFVIVFEDDVRVLGSFPTLERV